MNELKIVFSNIYVYSMLQNKLFSYRKYLIILVLSFYILPLHSQETLLYSPSQNNSTQNKHKKATFVNKDTSIIELPFIDDFSYKSISPDDSLWVDSGVFINNSYPVDPPTYGVATFDAINNSGNIHDDADYNEHLRADMLISKPINLQYSPDDNIIFSFYYQAEGKGDPPQPKDSLVLEYYSPQTEKWETQWSQKGDTAKKFKEVRLSINEKKYLQNGFKFKFKNYVSLTGKSYQARVSNVDHWHIDYVYLNKVENDTENLRSDVAIITPIQSLLKEYEAIPWKHYVHDNTQIPFKKTNSFTYRNLDNIPHLGASIEFVINNELSSRSPDTIPAGGKNLPSDNKFTFDDPLNYKFPKNKQDSARFKIKTTLVTDESDRKSNNSISFYQKFYNYYAYDDGTSEAGYGLTGEGTKYAKVAYKFHTYKEDTLRGVQMYLNKTLKDYTTDHYFYLTIWDNNNGKPGKELYSKTNYKPEYKDKLNRFNNYKLQSYRDEAIDTSIVVQDTFFIGWIKTTNEMMNIGYDFNRSAQNKLYYNINGIWEKSNFEGALMLRPVFGKDEKKIASDNRPQKPEKNQSNQQLTIYPNPARHFIKLDFPSPLLSRATIHIFNSNGQKIRVKKHITSNEKIPVNNLSKGIYLIRIYSDDNIYSGKFMIRK